MILFNIKMWIANDNLACNFDKYIGKSLHIGDKYSLVTSPAEAMRCKYPQALECIIIGHTSFILFEVKSEKELAAIRYNVINDYNKLQHLFSKKIEFHDIKGVLEDGTIVH